jgi:hypothetical protein
MTTGRNLKNSTSSFFLSNEPEILFFVRVEVKVVYYEYHCEVKLLGDYTVNAVCLLLKHKVILLCACCVC